MEFETRRRGSWDLDNALEQVKFRWSWGFHARALFVCGLANAADAVEILSIGFVLPFAEQLDLDQEKKGLISSCTFFGMLIGGYFWGGLADRYGRRSMLSLALWFNACFAFMSAFADQFTLFAVLRIGSGIGIGGSIPIVFAYFTFSWVFGSVLVALIARISFALLEPLTGWRLFLALCALPCSFAALLLSRLPRSPFFVLNTLHDVEAAHQIISQMHEMNGDAPSHDLSFIENDSDDDLLSPRDTVQTSSVPSLYTPNDACTNTRLMLLNTLELFSNPFFRRVTLLMSLVSFTLSFGFYGFSLWAPSLISNTSGASIDDILSSTLISALSQVPGSLISLYTVQHPKIGVRATLAGSMLLSGLAGVAVAFVRTLGELELAIAVFSGIGVAGWNALDILMTVVMPSRVRGTASGVFAAAGRVGAIVGLNVFGLFGVTNPALPLVLVGLLLGVGSVGAMMVSNTVEAGESVQGDEVHSL